MRRLQLIQVLTANSELTNAQICKQFGISLRTFYRYIAQLRTCGFELVCRHNISTILLTSPFYAKLTQHMHLNQREMQLVAQLVERSDPSDPLVEALRQKLHTIQGTESDNASSEEVQRVAHAAGLLRKAIAKRRKVVLHDYLSPHSQTTTDRLVEPFKLFDHDTSVRCYEPDSDTCKTFKLSRITSHVELLDEPWQSTHRHISYHTDIFGFSGETTHRVVLRLGTLATRILIEDYGVQPHQLVVDSDGQHRLFPTSVCSYEGVARFVLGLLSDVQVVRGNGLIDYISEVILHSQFGAASK